MPVLVSSTKKYCSHNQFCKFKNSVELYSTGILLEVEFQVHWGINCINMSFKTSFISLDIIPSFISHKPFKNDAEPCTYFIGVTTQSCSSGLNPIGTKFYVRIIEKFYTYLFEDFLLEIYIKCPNKSRFLLS